MSRLTLEGRVTATHDRAAFQARKVIGELDVRWLIACQDDRFFPVAIHRDSTDASPPVPGSERHHRSQLTTEALFRRRDPFSLYREERSR